VVIAGDEIHTLAIAQSQVRIHHFQDFFSTKAKPHLDTPAARNSQGYRSGEPPTSGDEVLAQNEGAHEDDQAKVHLIAIIIIVPSKS
jgi:hypothetical protein